MKEDRLMNKQLQKILSAGGVHEYSNLLVSKSIVQTMEDGLHGRTDTKKRDIDSNDS